MNVNYYNIPARDIYQGFVQSIEIETLKNLTFLQYGGRRSKASDLRLPSWVPDLFQFCGRSTWTREYSADQNLEFKDLEVTSNRCLRVNGCVCDHVNEAEESRYELFTSEPLEAFVKYALGSSHTSVVGYPSGGSRAEAFLRCYLLDVIPPGSRRLDMTKAESGGIILGISNLILKSAKMNEQSATAKQIQVLEESLVAGNYLVQDFQRRGVTFSADDKDILSGQEGALSFTSVVKANDYRFFHTKKGYLGVCPGGAEVGAEVCVLAGCKMPVLLKKMEDGHELIEVCFVLGFMDGEAAAQVRAGILKEQVFEIH